MADVKISALPAATTPLAGTEVLPIVQSSTTKKVAISDVTAGRAISASSLTLTTTPLAVGSGGTGLSTLTAGYIPYGNGTGAFSNNSYFTYSTSNGFQISSPAATSRLISANSAYDRADISLINGPTYAIRFGTSASGSQIEGVDYTGSTSYQPISLGGSLIQFTISGTEKMRITSAGDVGIGTTSPGYKLDVNAPAGRLAVNTTGYATGLVSNTGGSLLFGLESSAGGTLVTGSSAYSGVLNVTGAYSLAFGTSNTVRMTLDSVGNLGLGVTPSAWSGYKALQVASTGGALSSSSSSDFEITTNTYYSSGWLSQGAGVASSRYRLYAGTHAWYNAPSSTSGAAITFTQAMTLDASGRLGIGATSLGPKLLVKGNDAEVTSAMQGASGQFRLWGYIDATRGGLIDSINLAENSYLPLTVNGSVVNLQTGATTRAVIDASGNVVINTAAIATNATDGFLYVPTCAGTPTGTPTTYTGRAPIVVNTTNNKLYFYSGGAWRDAGP